MFVWIGMNTLEVSWWEETNSNLSWVDIDWPPLGNSFNTYTSSGQSTFHQDTLQHAAT